MIDFHAFLMGVKIGCYIGVGIFLLGLLINVVARLRETTIQKRARLIRDEMGEEDFQEWLDEMDRLGVEFGDVHGARTAKARVELGWTKTHWE